MVQTKIDNVNAFVQIEQWKPRKNEGSEYI